MLWLRFEAGPGHGAGMSHP